MGRFSHENAAVMPDERTVYLTDDGLHGPKVAYIKLVPVRTGSRFALKNILFELDESMLKPESKKELMMLFRMLMDEPKLHATIIGHTDLFCFNDNSLSKRNSFLHM